jgi:hypothetical protein
VLGELQLMGLAAVVEAGRALHLEADLAADTAHDPDQPMAVRRTVGVLDRHEVEHLAHPVGGHEPGDQDGGVGEVQLADHDVVAFGGDPEPAAPVAVQQGREHTGTVEPWAAEPVHTAVGRDQRRGLQISNQSMVGDRRVALHR